MVFTVVDDNNTAGPQSGRVRLFNLVNNQFNLLAATFSTVLLRPRWEEVSSQSITNISYTDVNTNDLVNVLLSATPIARSLPILDSFRIAGSVANGIAPITNNPAVFHLCKHKKIANYYLLGFSNTEVGTVPLQYQAPALLNVYEIKDNKFRFIDSATLNQFPTSYFLSSVPRRRLILLSRRI